MSVKIKAVTKQLPKYSRTTEEIIPFLDAWLIGQDERFIRKVKKIFEGAAVDKRYSIMDPIEVFTNTSFEGRNDIYVREMIDLGEKVLEKALQKAHWKPEDLDYIITVSCTGIMIPSLDAYLINKFPPSQSRKTSCRYCRRKSNGDVSIGRFFDGEYCKCRDFRRWGGLRIAFFTSR
jgi:alkylresorcinol/alkylpyrone synthase